MKALLRNWSKQSAGSRFFQAVHILVWLLLGTGFLVKSILTFSDLSRSGDEGFFLKELARFQADGLWNSFATGISHLHVLLVSVLTALVGSPVLAGRILSLILLPLAFYIGGRILKNTGVAGPVFYSALATLAYMLVFCQTGKMFFRFINDPLMVVMILGSLFFMQRFEQKGGIWYLVLSAIAAGLALWVRSFAILILAGVYTYLALKTLLNRSRSKSFIHLAIFVLLSMSVALIAQIPSLAEGRGLSFESKAGDGDWSERNWLTRLQRESNGGIFSYTRVSWEDIEQYKQIHGRESIPTTIKEIALTDPKFLVDNVVANLFVRIVFVMLISIGLFFAMFLDILRKPGWLLRASHIGRHGLLFWVTASLSGGLSLVIINYIEHRWLFVAVFCALVLGAVQLSRPRLEYRRGLLLGFQFIFLALASAFELLMVLLRGF